MGEKFHKQTTLPSYPSKTPEPLAIPETIGPYKIETLLTKGGMSLLYLGFDPATREPRVVKVLSPEYMNHPEMVDHFLWEAKIIGMTDHPNIVKLFDHGKWEKGLFIAMEFIRGVSLRQFLMQQSFSLKRCLDIILQVAYALCHLHTHGVVHRDLKPENILIAEDGEVKVIDFGIAQLHEDEPRAPHQIMGTPSYMSPEQKENPANVSFSSDIFSLGIIAYELVLGKLSYGMINLSMLPAGLQRILGKALAVSPEERYQDIVAFITDLTDYYKSPEIEKERTSSDLTIEMLENLQKSEKALSQFEKPNWNAFDIGIAYQRTTEGMGLYLDFFRFSNNTYAIIAARTFSPKITAVTSIAMLAGMIKSLVAPYKITDAPFEPAAFAEKLNELVYSDRMEEVFHLNILKLIPIQDTIVYLSCGPTGPLFHIPRGKNAPRTIHSENPLIGKEMGSSFNESADTMGDGDLFVFHNLEEKTFAEPLRKAITGHTLLSSGRLAQSLIKDMIAHEEYAKQGYPKTIVALNRIA